MKARAERSRRRILVEVLRALKEIRYGSLEIVIHDSRVVQIERREKVRLEATSRTGSELK